MLNLREWISKSKKNYGWKERLVHPFSFTFKCEICKKKFLHVLSTSKYKPLHCSKECDELEYNTMWNPPIKMRGKAYGQSPLSRSQVIAQNISNQHALLQQQNVMINNHALGMAAGIVNNSSIINYSGIATNSSVTIYHNNTEVMPFTAEKIERLKAIEPRKIEKSTHILSSKSPDYIEPITAWRAWAVEGNILKSLGRDNFWPKGTKQSAVCIKGSFNGDGKHEAPHYDCTCGVWAFKNLDLLLPAISAYSEACVIGQVSLWGRIVETENGYRAQYAYPKELWVLEAGHEELGYLYNVPVRLFSDKICKGDKV